MNRVISPRMVFPLLLVFRKNSFQFSSVQPIKSRANVRCAVHNFSRNSSLNFLCDIPQLYAQLKKVKSYFQGPNFRAVVMKHTYIAY